MSTRTAVVVAVIAVVIAVLSIRFNWLGVDWWIPR